jgi:uncharacterized protein YkvS
MKSMTVLAFVVTIVANRWPDCLSDSNLFARGAYFGWTIAGEVDSQVARALVEDEVNSGSLFQAYDRLPLTTDLLRGVQMDFSYDVSVLYFLRRAYNNNPGERSAFDSLLIDNSDDLGRLRKYAIVFVPGLGYKSDTTTGADFARQRRLLSQRGIENILVETDEWGLIEENASIIRNTIEKLRGKRLILVSASKGGLETLVALNKIQGESVRAWINIGGILHGTPIADDYLSWPKSLLASLLIFFEGGSNAMIEDMSYARRNSTYHSLRVPPHIKVVHYVGVPLLHQVSSEIEGRFCDLLEYGPNDGLTPVADELTSNGIIIAELGLDHYYRDLHIDRKTLALARMTASILEQ